MTVQTLIDKACEKVGNRNRLAGVLQVTRSLVYDWYAGRKRCNPADRARLASLANEDPLQELVRATLEETEGTPRGEQLARILGKWSPRIGGALHSVALTVVNNSCGAMMIDIPRCIKRIVIRWLYR